MTHTRKPAHRYILYMYVCMYIMVTASLHTEAPFLPVFFQARTGDMLHLIDNLFGRGNVIQREQIKNAEALSLSKYLISLPNIFLNKMEVTPYMYCYVSFQTLVWGTMLLSFSYITVYNMTEHYNAGDRCQQHTNGIQSYHWPFSGNALVSLVKVQEKQGANKSSSSKESSKGKGKAEKPPEVKKNVSSKGNGNVNVEEQKCAKHKYVVYTCQKGRICGGLGDRQQGIVSAYILAMLTNRSFVLDMNYPCDISRFQVPNLYDWTACKEYALKVNKKNVALVNLIDVKGLFTKLIKNQSSVVWKKQVISLRINWIIIDMLKEKIYSVIPWTRGFSTEEIIQIVMHILFRPVDSLTEDVNSFLANSVQGRTLVCSHIRIGRNPSIPHDAAQRIGGATNQTVILEFLQNYSNASEYALFLATDSDEVRQACYAEFENCLSFNKTIVHIDRFKGLDQETACQGFSDAVLDQMLLTKCDVLVVSRSNFGGMAAYMRGNIGNLFMYNVQMNDVVSVPYEEAHLKYKLA